MAWIESHQEVAHHPKTRKLARRLGVDLATAIGHLHALWWWALSYAEDGNLHKHTDEDVALGALWDAEPRTFVDALVDCRWLDRDGESTVLHDWDEYAGRLVDRRKANAERKRLSRARHEDGDETDEGVTGLQNPTEPNPTEPTKPNRESGARKKAIDEGWKPSEQLIDWAIAEYPDLDIILETKKFKDHFAANGKPMKNWEAAWRNWLRRCADFAPRQQQGFANLGRGRS